MRSDIALWAGWYVTAAVLDDHTLVDVRAGASIEEVARKAGHPALDASCGGAAGVALHPPGTPAGDSEEEGLGAVVIKCSCIHHLGKAIPVERGPLYSFVGTSARLRSTRTGAPENITFQNPLAVAQTRQRPRHRNARFVRLMCSTCRSHARARADSRCTGCPR